MIRQMWGMMGYCAGWSWIWMTVTMLLFWGGLIVIGVWAARSFGRSNPTAGSDSALEILRRRLAAGEISQDEFDKTRKALLS